MNRTRDDKGSRSPYEVREPLALPGTIAFYLKSGFVPKMTKELVSPVVEGIEGDPSRATVLFFQHCGGASSRVPGSATAFAHRDAVANILTMTA